MILATGRTGPDERKLPLGCLQRRIGAPRGFPNPETVHTTTVGGDSNC